MDSDRKVFSLDEVSVHNTNEDCWVIINAKVYNVTNFLNDHPGGDEVLLAASGKDASEEFEDAGHGSAARLMLDEFYVGETDPSTKWKTTSYVPSNQSHNTQDNSDKSSEFIIKLLQFSVPLVILGLAIHLYT